MKKILSVFLVAVLMLSFLLPTVVLAEETPEEESLISVQLQENGTFLFTNLFSSEAEGAKYAWYVVDNTSKEAIFKGTYSGDNTFTFNFQNDNVLDIISYVRVYSGKEYTQNFYTISSTDAINTAIHKAFDPALATFSNDGELCWEKIIDGRYIIKCMSADTEKMNRYAWYVVDNTTGEKIVKSWYTEDNLFLYDIAGNDALTFMSFWRVYDGDTYEQHDYQTISSADILATTSK